MSEAGAGKASLVSLGCLLRGLPLFFGGAPRTPLRVMGIVSLDTLHVLRHSRPLPRARVRALAAFLDLEGCANAAWDRKRVCVSEYLTLRRRLDDAGLGGRVTDYLDRLQQLEVARPAIGGDLRGFNEVRAYREAVARLSLAAAAGIALGAGEHAAEGAAENADDDVDTLFRILMQCQIIDDVLDYREDATAGLPSFLTGARSLGQAVAMTAAAARDYGATGAASRAQSALPLRLALYLFTAAARLAVARFSRVSHRVRGGDL